MSVGMKVLPNPVKSENDKKDYKVIELPNGLRALLISDTTYPLEKLQEEEIALAASEEDEEDIDEEEEEDSDEDLEEEEEDEDEDGDEDEDEMDEDSEGPPRRKQAIDSGLKKSAAGLCVGMGSFSDPTELPGLAHFLEHMVFMGSAKFPKENAFDDFIQKHGGTDNAATDCETTVFYFECQRRSFHEGLDRFAQFFVEPKMRKDSMSREREAVDSEFQMSLPSDYYRKQQIFGGLAKEGHPMGKFMWGNLESLKPSNELTDAQIHEKLHAFKNRHYSAQSMTLVVQSQETLDTLEKWVVECFTNVPNNGLERESFDSMNEPFKTERFHKIYKVAPVQNIYQVDLYWALPSMLKKYKVKPLHYLSWIIGHEGKGSLVSYLRKKVWALSLTAGNAGDGFEQNSTYSIFSITIVLTKKGHENIEKVLEAVFSYIKMLKQAGPSERIYKEIQKIEELDFRFRQESQPMENVETLCENMQNYPSELYINGDDLMFEYDPVLISECLDNLSPEGVNIFRMAREFKGECDQTEPWFRTKYREESIPAEWEEKWRNLKIIEGMHLPEPNKFIAEDVDMKPFDSEATPYPTKLVSSGRGELFFKKDNIFLEPRACINLFLASPFVMESAHNAVSLDLLVNCIVQQMIEDTYPADLAQLSHSFYAGERGITMKLTGLNDKLSLLLDSLISHLINFEENVTLEMYEAVKEQTKKNYYNYFLKPAKLCREIRLKTLQDVFSASGEKHALISGVDLEEVKKFFRSFMKDIYVQGLVQGNMTSNEAKSMFEATLDKIGCPNEIAIRETRCREIPCGSRVMRVNTLNPRDNNTVVTNYYQLGKSDVDMYTHMLLELACMIVEEPVFDVLRTNEQLGYHVFSMLRNTCGVLGLSVTVNSQATKFSANHIDDRIEAFLDWFVNEKLAKLSEEEFRQVVNTLINMKKTRDVTLDEEVGRNWGEITSREYVFDRMQRDIELLETRASLEDVRSFFAKLMKGGCEFRKLSVQVVGSTDIADETLEENGFVDQDPDTEFTLEFLVEDDKDRVFVKKDEEFRATLKTFPVIHIVK